MTQQWRRALLRGCREQGKAAGTPGGLMRCLRLRILGYAICILSLIDGCAATNQFVPRPRNDLPPPGKAIIRVQRPSGGLGSGRAVTVRDNGTPIGELGPGGELAWERPGG